MNNTSKEMFGKRLIELRESKNLTQKQCATALGMDDSSKYNKWENGKNSPDYDTVCELANFFGVTTDFILGNSRAKKPVNEDISKRLGLSEKAIEVLEGKHSVKYEKGTFKDGKENPFTQTVNALIEEQSLLRLISWYLHFEPDEDLSDENRTLSLRYKYLEYDGLHPYSSEHMEPTEVPYVFNDKECKKIVMLEIQEALMKLLEKEQH